MSKWGANVWIFARKSVLVRVWAPENREFEGLGCGFFASFPLGTRDRAGPWPRMGDSKNVVPLLSEIPTARVRDRSVSSDH